jgi:hypothetical protein
MDMIDLIDKSVSNLDNTRKLIKENSGWMVQYLPCGHSREINWNEIELVEKAKNNKHIDAVILNSHFCPICRG